MNQVSGRAGFKVRSAYNLSIVYNQWEVYNISIHFYYYTEEALVNIFFSAFLGSLFQN